MSEDKDDSSGVVQRLEELDQWQEEQQKILFERQNNQRKLIGLQLQHGKMNETLAIFHSQSGFFNKYDGSENYSSGKETDLGVMALNQTIEEEIKDCNKQIVEKLKQPFLRRKQGLINRFKVDPDQFRLDNLPPYKFSSNPSLKRNGAKEHPRNNEPKDAATVSKSVLKLIASDNPEKNPSLDALEKKFQNFLISSENACNSTPDMKSQCFSVKDPSEPISWATILGSQNVKFFEKLSCNSSIVESEDYADNMSIFELLEQKPKVGSFDLNSSCIKKFLRNTNAYSYENELESPINLKLPRIPYKLESCRKLLVTEKTETEIDEDTTLTSVPRVRFADDPIKQKKQTPSSLPSSAFDKSDISQYFEEFKKLFFANQNDTSTTSENSQGHELAQEILRKTDLIRTRLSELEAEISVFKQNNLKLVRSKQEHELKKVHFKQERIEAAEKLNDERIKMEIYVHDERMKIEQDRHRMEKQIQNQKALNSGKEKREISKLQEEIKSLQKEIKKKEETHVAAQSRLRAQVKNLEKDIRHLNVNVDSLEKDNERLEAENSKINRQNNNKILQEINRNIANIAPKVHSVAYIEETPSANFLTVTKQNSKLKSVLRRRSSEVHQKAGPLKGQDTPVNSSDGELSNESFDKCGHQQVNSEVTFAKSPTLPQTITTIKTNIVETNESLGTSTDASFKREILNPDGSKDIWYPNGNLKKITSDGMIIRMLYFNKDIKETNINEGIVKYYYAETNTWHTTYLDGLEILEFPNGQTELRYKDGKIEIYFPNSSIKVTNPLDENKLEEWRFADGSSLIQMKNGDKILLMVNGQKEIHTTLSKRREYPDGTVKLLYVDGSQETRYSNGRVRLKDKDGNLVMDTENVK